jgi:hypothetical protein
MAFGKAHSLSEEIGDTQFVSVLDQLQIRSMTTIRNLEMLKRLVTALEEFAARTEALPQQRGGKDAALALSEVVMCNVQMIRKEQGLISIPLERAVFCENCERVSNSAWRRCGACGSDKLLELLLCLADRVSPAPDLRPRA